MELAIEFTIGVCFLVSGMSWMLRTDIWAECFARIREEGRHKALGLGLIELLISAFVVGGHPVWTGLPLLLTIIGICGMLEGTFYLLFPRALPRILLFFEPRTDALKFMGFIFILLGAVILYAWWRQIGNY